MLYRSLSEILKKVIILPPVPIRTQLLEFANLHSSTATARLNLPQNYFYRVFRGYLIFVGDHYKECIPSNTEDL